jgi:hypothetical protein
MNGFPVWITSPPPSPPSFHLRYNAITTNLDKGIRSSNVREPLLPASRIAVHQWNHAPSLQMQRDCAFQTHWFIYTG